MHSASISSACWRCGRTWCSPGTRARRCRRSSACGRSELTVATIATSRLADVAEALRVIGEIARRAGRGCACSRAVRKRDRRAARGVSRSCARQRIRADQRSPDLHNQRTADHERSRRAVRRTQRVRRPQRAGAGRQHGGGHRRESAGDTCDGRRSPRCAAHWRRWRHIDAVRTGNVYTISSDHVARATLRLADGAREVCRTLDAARARAGSAKGGGSR